jgi:DNA-binding XRE family transcriptional regulator
MADKRLKPNDGTGITQVMDEFFAQFSSRQTSINDAVRQMRKISRLTQPEFAKHRKVALVTLRDIEQDKGNPSVDTLNKIGQVFGLEVGFVRCKK